MPFGKKFSCVVRGVNHGGLSGREAVCHSRKLERMEKRSKIKMFRKKEEKKKDQ